MVHSKKTKLLYTVSEGVRIFQAGVGGPTFSRGRGPVAYNV